MGADLIVVLDVGKTYSKLTLWRDATMVRRETRANAIAAADGYIALDAAGIEDWIACTLADFARCGDISAIVPVAHGAAAAIIANGRLALPPMDYETVIPLRERLAYDSGRAQFDETGSPRLPNGLNLGAQLHYLETRDSALRWTNAMILLWPQYWAWRLCGVAAAEVSSLGCHSDLWNPTHNRPSSLAFFRGWTQALPPVRRADAVLGTVSPEWQQRCGLSPATKIYCGVHDTNAALLAARGLDEVAGKDATVLSTGTWFIAMRTPATGQELTPANLPETRDCLMNVDVEGRSIPSARFMGGREIERLVGSAEQRIDIADDQTILIDAAARVLSSRARVLPTFASGVGPFPDHHGRWIDEPLDPILRRVAVSLYGALVADVLLDLLGARETILIEGRFAAAEIFVRALAALRPRDRVFRANRENDVSFGALRLIDPTLRTASMAEPVTPLEGDVAGYAAQWRRDVLHAEDAL